MIGRLCIALVVVVTFSSSAFAVKKPGEILKSQLMEVNKTIKSIDSTTLMKWFDAPDKEFTLLDVREPKEISAAKIEADGYIAIPRGLVEMQFIRKVKELEKPVVVYCMKGGRSAFATEALTQLGYTNVYNLQGGIIAWLEAGYPVSNFLGEFEVQNFESNF